MIKKTYIIILVLIAFVNSTYAQTTLDENFIENEVPKEKVFLHVNSSLLFSGEKLLYKFYTLNTQNNQLSELSKIGWVVLVNSDKEEVFKHKIRLEGGKGYSDFFVPSDLPSGAYKLLGYTAWMLNAKENYFEQDIHILNPYQSENQVIAIKDSVHTSAPGNISESNPSKFSLNLNKSSFSPREQVVLTANSSSQITGSFSISVRKKDSFNKPALLTSANFNESYKNVRWDFSDTLILP